MMADDADVAVSGDGTHGETKKTRMIGNVTEEFLLKRAKEMAMERTRDWEVTDLKAEQRFPRFHRDGTHSKI